MALPDHYQPRADLLADKVILVTGAGDGIGRAASIAYAQHGATVLLLGRTISKLEQLFDDILAAGLPEPGIIPADIGTLGTKTLDEITEVIGERYARLDGILHNAAILGQRIPVEHYDLTLWDQVMQVNFNGAVLLTRFLLPIMQQSKSASLLFTSSSVGVTPRAYWGPYAASKYALEGFAKLLAEELENTSEIRVNVVDPGATRTNMRHEAYPNEDPKTLKSPEDLMRLYVYLMGEDSQGEHGQRFTG